jgi:AcrR family transcriptional regulator
MPVKPWRRAQVIGTREHLIETAARLFGRRGYVGVVREAGLSRGAVYHHFEDKRALFEAVIERALRDLVFAVEKRTVKLLAQTGTERPADAARLFAEELSRPAIHRIVALDGPAVLGPERFSTLLGDQLQEPLERPPSPACSSARSSRPRSTGPGKPTTPRRSSAGSRYWWSACSAEAPRPSPDGDRCDLIERYLGDTDSALSSSYVYGSDPELDEFVPLGRSGSWRIHLRLQKPGR